MRSFSKLVTLLVGVILGVFGALCYFHVPINFNPITVFATGEGDVDIKNEVNQGQPVPSNPSATPKSPPALAVSTPQVTKNESQSEVPVNVSQSEIRRPSPPNQTVFRTPIRSNHSYSSLPRSYEEQDCDQPTFQKSPEPTSIRWRRYPVTVVRHDDPEDHEFDDSEDYESTTPQTGGYSRSSSSTRVIVNGKVVRSSSVTVVNGRVVSRTEFPPPQP